MEGYLRSYIHNTASFQTALLGLGELLRAGFIRSIAFSELLSDPITDENLENGQRCRSVLFRFPDGSEVMMPLLCRRIGDPEHVSRWIPRNAVLNWQDPGARITLSWEGAPIGHWA